MKKTFTLFLKDMITDGYINDRTIVTLRSFDDGHTIARGRWYQDQILDQIFNGYSVRYFIYTTYRSGAESMVVDVEREES